jgi:hypothetical protein
MAEMAAEMQTIQSAECIDWAGGPCGLQVSRRGADPCVVLYACAAAGGGCEAWLCAGPTVKRSNGE